MAIAGFFRALLTMMVLAAGAILFTSPAEAAEPPPPVESRFDTDLDGWMVAGDPASGYPRHVATGGNPGGFVRTVDGTRGVTMYWKAPDKFLGDRSAYYGGTLSFNLKQSTANSPYNDKEVLLTGGGLSLTLDLSHPSTQWTSYKIPLRPSAGWLKSTGGAPTEQEMRAVLGDLEALQIRAEYSSIADTDDLDNVVLANERPTISEIAEQTIQEDTETGALAFTVGDAESASNDLVLAGRSSNLDLVPEGSITFGGTGENRTVTVTPAKDRFGEAQITVNVSDGEFSNEESFLLKVNPVNDAPVAREGSLTTDEDTAKAVILEASDVEGEPLTYTVVRGPIHGTLSGAAPNLAYTPAENYEGPDSFTFKAADGEAESAETTVSIEVNPVNDAPVASTDAYSVDEDQTLNVGTPGLLGNDTDVEHDALHVSDNDAGTPEIDPVSGPSHGTVSLNANGSFSYTPNANYAGPDSFDYLVCDNGSPQKCSVETAKVNVTVSPVNDAPVANNDSAQTDEDTAIASIPILDNDSDVENEALKAIKVTGAAHGTVTLNSDNKTFSYTPEADFNGTDEFTYNANDGTDDSNVATVRITVKSVNDPPVALPDFITVAEDGEKSFDATTNDHKGPANESTETLSVDSVVAQANHGTATKNPDGTIKYVPNANYNGPDTFTYKVCDDGKTNGSLDSKCSIAPVNVNVTPVNDAPVADNDAYPVDEDQTLTIAPPGVLSNDSEVDGENLTAARVTGPAHGQLTLKADGSFTYTPDADYTGPDSFTYKVNDGTADSNEATVNIPVKAVNDAPVAKDLRGDDSQVTTPEDTAKGITLEASDVDSRNLTFTTMREPIHGTLSGDGANLTYTPNKDFNGSDSFTFEVCDDGQPQQCDQATVDILVTAVNDDPVATADEYTINEDAPITVNAATGVLHNDTDLDGESLTAELISGPEHGTLTLNPDGSFTYTPAANYTGSDTFTYKAIDPSNGEASATVTVTITATNDDPVANDDSGTTDEDTPLTIDVEANDPDVDGDILSISEFTQPQNGTVTLDEGKLRYVPKDNYHGPDTFTYTVSDGKGGTATAQVSIMVNAVNDLPVANADNISVGEDGEQIFDPTLNDSTGPADEADQMLKVDSIASPPTHGTATLIISGPNAGKLSYRPDDHYNGADEFTYKVCDNGESNGRPDTKCATAKVTITVLISVVYDWTGFFRPVDNRDVDGNYIVNVANAGSAIPVKFSLSGDQGLDIFATAADGTSYPKSGVTACDPTAQFDTIEQTVAASASGLTYDASIDQYTYVWKTGNAWAGSCRQLVVKLNDGTVHRAYFKFK